MLMTKLRNALSVLPQNLQEMFVDRVVTFVVDPDSFRQQVDAISSLAMAAASEARNRMGGTEDTSGQTNALASSILGAWLSRYRAPSAVVGNSNEASYIQLPVSSSTVNDPLAPVTNNVSTAQHHPLRSQQPPLKSEELSFMPSTTAL